jgi:hypothetical protein
MRSAGAWQLDPRAGNGTVGDYLPQAVQDQNPIVEQAIETAPLMLRTDKSRGYCLEMICADFLAGANLDNEDPTALLHSMSRFLKVLPGEQKHAFLTQVKRQNS